jgi:hypothetical protein
MKLPEKFTYTGRSIAFRDNQALISSIKILDIDSPSREKEILDCRLYTSRSTCTYAVRCIIWIKHTAAGVSGSGVGIAQGYGYHKGSAAIEAALKDFGLSDFKSFSGVGYEAAIATLLQFAAEMGYTNTLPVVTYP